MADSFSQWIAQLQAKISEVQAAADAAELFRQQTAAALNQQSAAQDQLAAKLAELKAMLA